MKQAALCFPKRTCGSRGFAKLLISGLACAAGGPEMLGCGKANARVEQGVSVEPNASAPTEPIATGPVGTDPPALQGSEMSPPTSSADLCVMGEFLPLGPIPAGYSTLWRAVDSHSGYLFWSYEWEGVQSHSAQLRSVLFRWTSTQGITSIGEFDNLDLAQISATGELFVGSHFSSGGLVDGFRWTQAGVTALSFIPFATSADGNVLVGGEQDRLVIWTDSAGEQLIDDAAGLSSLSRLNVSAAADVVVASVSSGRSFRWTQATGSVDGGAPDGALRKTMFTSINPDGSALAGVTFNSDNFNDARSQRWTKLRGWQDLGTFPGAPDGSSSTPDFISDDGSAIVGRMDQVALENQYYHPFRWTEAAGMQDIVPGAENSAATYVSPSGDVVIGNFDGTQSFRWTEATGVQRFDYAAWPGIAADGDLIVGTNAEGPFALTFGSLAGTQPGLVARIGMQLLPEGWTEPRLEGISNDASLLFGEATDPTGMSEAWLLRLPDRCH
jgi:uncharacterized membrane protein